MYTEHYGFRGQPFQLTPDARFWFESRTHKRAMAYLDYGLAQGEGFIVVTGEIGAGKSTLVAHLLATLDRNRFNTISLVSTQIEGDDILRLTAQGLGIATASVEKARLLDGVEQRFEEELRAGKRTLLIVDEAQNLPISALEELRMLSNFQVGGRALVQILLLGQPEFRSRLASSGLEQLRQRVIAIHHLEAMTGDEVEAYVRHRLAEVGWHGRPGFSASAGEALHRLSEGIPRRVNQLANRVLLQAALENADEIRAGQVEAVAGEMDADSLVEPQKVLPIRSARRPSSVANEGASTPMPGTDSPSQHQHKPQTALVPDPMLERKLAELEARMNEQEATLRRVLTLLIEWVENGNSETSYRTHAS